MLHIVGAWLWSIVYSFIKIYSFCHIFWLAFVMVSFNYFVLFSCISLKSLLNWCLSLLGYEICSRNVLDQILQMWRRNFDVKILYSLTLWILLNTHSIQMHPTFQHGRSSEEEKVIDSVGDFESRRCQDIWNLRGMPFVKSTKGYFVGVDG